MAKTKRPAAPPDDPLWYRDAIIYELHVRSFFDSTGDGIGDFPGLTAKLDYLQELGVTALWILPFYPSPLRDDGYDIADYGDINPSYGNMKDFRAFLKEAHRRGLHVITELVINHTSDQHAWFQRARKARPDSPWRDWYVWSDTPEKYRDARIIFQDFEHSNWTYDHIARSYYWHRFYSHQPDLNWENEAVRDAVFKVMDRWFAMGVDGMRLDAIPYLFEREGTNCENLPETHIVLRNLRAHLDEGFPGKMLLAEANQWPEDAAAYFGDGDECHMNFHFPLMPRLFMAVRMEDRFPIVDILKQTPPIPSNCQWAIFLRNHDELTLEMVTDEERDYMYRVYATDRQARINLGIRRRLAPLLQNHRRKIELMTSLLLSLPGTPVLYYGDEIGMGDNIYLGDRNGVRTPMQWSSDRNAGFSRSNPQRLFLPVITDPEYHYEAVNVEAQEDNPSSLLWWTRRLIGLRKQFRAFGRGSLDFVSSDNRKVLAFVRAYEDERILVVVNLSRFTQPVWLELSRFAGALPVELFGRTEFPPVGEQPYFLTLAPHTFHWFALAPAHVRAEEIVVRHPEPGVLQVAEAWQELLDGTARPRLERALPAYMQGRRWFRGKARRIRGVRIVDSMPVPIEAEEAVIVLAEVTYTDGDAETYVLPLAYASGMQASHVYGSRPDAVVARIATERGGEGVLYDATGERAFASVLLSLITGRKRLSSEKGEGVGVPMPELKQLGATVLAELEPIPARVEQSNTSIAYGDRLILKLLRRLEEGVSLDFEIGRFLTERGFKCAPAVLGSFDYEAGTGEPHTLALLFEYIPNEGDAWSYTLDELGRFFERASAQPHAPADGRPTTQQLLELARTVSPAVETSLLGPFMDSAARLGRRTAELHIALSDAGEDPAFRPEPFSTHYQRSIYQSMRNTAGRALQALAGVADRLSPPLQQTARQALAMEERIFATFKALLNTPIHATRIRTHGDYHLGQVLFTGKDFIITDFEGEPLRPLSERRIKRSPLRDVAGMLRSFHYAAYTALDRQRAVAAPDATERLERWALAWYSHAGAAFLRGYLESARGHDFCPEGDRELMALLDAFVVEKAVYELWYELNNRPEWAWIPLQGILQLAR